MSKPKPPADLWAQMDAIRQKHEMESPPSDAFTTSEYADRYSVGRKAAEEQLKKMCAAGSVVRIGQRGRHIYYQLA